MKQLVVLINKDWFKQLKLLGIENEKTVSQLVREFVADGLRKMGKEVNGDE